MDSKAPWAVGAGTSSGGMLLVLVLMLLMLLMLLLLLLLLLLVLLRRLCLFHLARLVVVGRSWKKRSEPDL